VTAQLEDKWSPAAIRKDQLADKDLKPILEWKEAGTGRPPWLDVSDKGVSLNSYWAQWDPKLRNRFCCQDLECLRCCRKSMEALAEDISRHTDPDTYVGELERRMSAVHDHVRSRLQLENDRMKTRYNVRANSSSFQEGDLVWLYNPVRRKERSPKLQNNWEGPFTVIKRINDVVYRIQRNPRSKMKVVHLDRLTPYRGETDRDDRS
ncbi:hypothetical protein NQ318_004765, partial [Aromia moschata]